MRKVSVVTFILIMSSIPGIAFAGIFNVTGNATDTNPLPPNFFPGSDTTDRLVAGIYQETTCMTLPFDVPFDIDPASLSTFPEIFDEDSDYNFGSIPAGTQVDGFFIQMDSLSSGDVSNDFTIVFDQPILGISMDDFSLDLSDSDIGNAFGGSGDGYPSGLFDRGLDVPPFDTAQDSLTVVDQNTIRVQGTTGAVGGIDQVRVVTLAQPDGCVPLPVNQPPELDPIDDQTVDEGDTKNISISSVDADGDTLTLSSNNKPDFCSLVDNGDGTGQFTCTPGFEDSGTFQVTVTVTDDGTPPMSDDETFQLTVNNTIETCPLPNNLNLVFGKSGTFGFELFSPQFAFAIGDLARINGEDNGMSETKVDKSVTLDGSGSLNLEEGMPNNFCYQWRMVSQPSGSMVSIASAASQVTLTPTHQGNYVIELTVTDRKGNDSGDQDSTTHTVNVGPINQNPMAFFTTTPANPKAGDTVTVNPGLGNILGTGDPDNPDSDLNFRWFVVGPSGDPSPTIIPNKNHRGPITFVAGADGVYDITLDIDDGEPVHLGTDTFQSSITVNPPNNPPTTMPTFMPTAPKTGDTVTLDAGGNDIDGDPLTFQWDVTDPDGGPVSLDDPTSDTPTFTPMKDGSYTATVTVNDGNGGTATGTVTVPVTPAPTNTPPTVQITSPTDGSTFIEGQSITFVGSANDNEDGNLSNQITWTLRDDDGFVLEVGVGSQFSATIQFAGEYTVEADVEDSEGLMAPTSTITITVEKSAKKNVAPGFDLFKTEPGTKFEGEDFKGEELGEFDFDGTSNGFTPKAIGIKDTGSTDTIVKRLSEATVPDVPGSDTIDIELVALQLVSVKPIDLGAGLDVHYITLQSIHGGPSSVGMMEIRFNDENGGTFDSFFDVFFDVRIGSLNGPIIFSDVLTLESFDVPWSHTPDPNTLLIKGVNHLLSPGMDSSQDFFPTGVFSETKQGDSNTVHVVGPTKVIKKIVGGNTIPIETTSLIIVSAQSFSWMIPVVLSGIGISLYVVSRKNT